MENIAERIAKFIEGKSEETVRDIFERAIDKVNMKKHMFAITSVCREDIIQAFDDTDILEQVKGRVASMDDSEMKHLAGEMADDYCEQLFWDSLRTIFEDRFLK